jgi:hypothetical protein
MPNGKLNWYSAVSEFQRDTLGRVEIALNSVMLKNATVRIVNQGLQTDMTLQNLNAEITAQSLYGPYRIDGNFIKDKKPAGFALNLGTLSESFGTSLNLVLTHPATHSYARFDGQMMAHYDELEGNFSVESKNPAKFANEFGNQVILPLEFDYPLSGSAQIKISPKQIDLTGVVLKYGESAGAGNALIPLKTADGARRKIELSFEMTALDLMPVAGMIGQQMKNYTGNKPYHPDFGFDLIADIKALKATAKNATIRNFELSADVINDVISVKKLTGLFPGDTDITTSGDIFENDDRLSYDVEFKSTSQDFLKFAEWLDVKPKTYAPSTYRGAQLSAKVSGTPDQIKIAPLSFSLDNNLITGIVGIVRGQRIKIFASAQSEKINFDNYLPAETDEEKAQPFNERLKRRLQKLKFLDDYDVQVQAKLTTGIYNKTPFEKTDLKFSSDNGRIKLDKLHIEDVASASVDLSGSLSGLAANPSVENLKYRFETTHFDTFRKHFDLPLPSWPLFDKAESFKTNGIMTGNTDLINVKAVTNINGSFVKSVYTGKLFNQNNHLNFIGRLEFNTEFVKFVNALGWRYKPQKMPTSVFTFKGVVAGNAEKWTAKEIDAFISSNRFQGSFDVETKNGRPFITADLQTSRFEFDRLIYNDGVAKSQKPENKAAGTVPFLAPLQWPGTKINYEFYKAFDLDLRLIATLFDYDVVELRDAAVNLQITDGTINLRDFQAVYQRGDLPGNPIKAAFELTTGTNPHIKGTAQIMEYVPESIGGTRYDLRGGRVNVQASYDTSASSAREFLNQLSGRLAFDLKDFVLEGWNLNAVIDDLYQRDATAGLNEIVKQNLSSGSTPFSIFAADLVFTNGAFKWKDALMSSDRINLELSGTGDVKKWTTDTTFRVIVNGDDGKIAPFNIFLKGSIADPALSYDMRPITDKYDAHWAQVASERKEREEREAAELKAAMDQVQQQVSVLRERVLTEIVPLLQKDKAQSINSTVKSVYDSAQIQLTDIKNRLEMMADKAKENYTMTEVMEMSGQVETLAPQLDEVQRRINENHMRDLKLHAGAAYQEMGAIFANAQEKKVNYEKTLDAYVERLIKLKSLVVLDREPRAMDYKQAVEEELRTLTDLKTQADNLKTSVELGRDLSEVEVQSAQMTDLRSTARAELDKLNDTLENLFEYAKNLVYEEEKISQERRATQDDEEDDDEEDEEDDEEDDEDESEASVPEEVVVKVVEEVDEMPRMKSVSSSAADESAVSGENKPKAEQPEPDEQVPDQGAEANGESPSEPLLKPLNTTDSSIVSYAPKVSSSGSVVKKVGHLSQTDDALVSEERPLLLKTVGKDTTTSGGTLTRKKPGLGTN